MLPHCLSEAKKDALLVALIERMAVRVVEREALIGKPKKIGGHCGILVITSKIRDHLRWTIRVGKRRFRVKAALQAAYAARAE